MPTTNAKVRRQYEAGGALNEHGNDDHEETYSAVGHGNDDHEETYSVVGHGGDDHAFAFIPTVADTASEPDGTDLDGGEVWFNVDTSEFRGYDGIDFLTFDTTADA